MLGHSVLALEQRTEFGRLNILHLWDWVANDLAELGIKDLDPSIFASGDYLHCGTSQLQHSLLKIALLVGVQVRLGANVRTLADLRAVEPHQARTTSRRSLEWPADVRLSLDNAPGVPPLLPFGASSDAVEGLADGVRGMHLSVGGRPLPTLQVQQRRRSEDAVFNADVLVDATGARCELFRTIGFEQVTALKSARALGVVVHFHNRKTPTENALEEKNWAQQYHKARFEQLKERGVQLQNLVYYRSTGAFSEVASHYFVMTAESGSLRAMGALRSTDVPEWQLCQSANVDRTQLEAFVRIAVSEFVPALADAELVAKQGVQIFDFSERKVSNKASVLIDATRLHGAPGAQVLVTRVGDALQEPFWPEGLGINRGFLHVLDCADMVQGYAALLRRYGRCAEHGGADAASRAAAAASMLQRREELFALTKRVSGTNRLTELKPTRDSCQKAMTYTIDPASRYVQLPRSLPARFADDERLER